MILLDITHSTDSTGLAALITAGGGVGSMWLKMVIDKTKMKTEIEQIIKDADKLEKDLKEKLIEVKASKNAKHKELESMLEKTEQVLHQRIDRVRDDNIKSYEKLENKINEVQKEITNHTQLILDAINKK